MIEIIPTNIVVLIAYSRTKGVQHQDTKGTMASVVDIADQVLSNSPLHIAAAAGNLALLTRLMDKGDRPIMSRLSTPGCVLIFIFFARSSGAKVNAKNALGNVPLHTAAVRLKPNHECSMDSDPHASFTARTVTV